MRFAGRHGEKFAGLDVGRSADGDPVLSDALARLECRVRDAVTGGTHTVFFGEVQRAEASHGRSARLLPRPLRAPEPGAGSHRAVRGDVRGAQRDRAGSRRAHGGKGGRDCRRAPARAHGDDTGSHRGRPLHRRGRLGRGQRGVPRRARRARRVRAAHGDVPASRRRRADPAHVHGRHATPIPSWRRSPPPGRGVREREMWRRHERRCASTPIAPRGASGRPSRARLRRAVRVRLRRTRGRGDDMSATTRADDLREARHPVFSDRKLRLGDVLVQPQLRLRDLDDRRDAEGRLAEHVLARRDERRDGVRGARPRRPLARLRRDRPTSTARASSASPGRPRRARQTKRAGLFATSHVPTIHPILAAKQGDDGRPHLRRALRAQRRDRLAQARDRDVRRADARAR